MSFKATDKILENMVGFLNDVSKCKYEIGHSYGKVHLYKKSMECTGISDISLGNTKKELYYQLNVLLDYLRIEKTDKADYVKNCTHHDVYNIHGLKEDAKIDASNIDRYGENDFKCLTCKKSFTKKQYETSHNHKTKEQLRKMRVKN